MYPFSKDFQMHSYINLYDFTTYTILIICFEIRFLVTTASLKKDPENIDEEDVKFILSQVAEKDVWYKSDSEVVFEVRDDGDLIMTTTIFTDDGPVSGTRTFVRFDLDTLHDIDPIQGRRNSALITPNLSRRGSFDVASGRRGSDLFAPNLSRRGSYNVPSRRASNIELSEEALQSLLKISERRLSLPRNRIQLLPPGQQTELTPSIEISHYD